MLEALIKRMENTIDTDEFELIQEECIEEIERLNLGLSAVEPLLKFIECYPLADFGMPGAIVHYVESFYKNGYEDILYESVKRCPTTHTVWMLNRICNDENSSHKFRELLVDIAKRDDINNTIAEEAKGFLEQ